MKNQEKKTPEQKVKENLITSLTNCVSIMQELNKSFNDVTRLLKEANKKGII